ncbi:MAG TPA: SgcJ/EcaC family oxidoreductase [Gemmatimonadales bacterium]|jgi:uncharacterized protein (TIGR02246 family)
MTAKPVLRPILGLGAAFLAGCSSEAPGRNANSRGAVEATVDRYVAASNEGDAEALTELYADDAVLLPPDHEPIRGREAIGEFWRQGTDTGLEVSTLRLEVDGTVAYLIGRYHLPPTEGEEADSGQYVLCLKRQSDGSWKLTADIWNGSGGSDERGADGNAPGPAISSATPPPVPPSF